VLRAGEVDGSGRFVLPFAVRRRAPEPELTDLGRPPLRMRLSWRWRTRAQLVPLAILCVLLLLGRLRLAGVALALYGLEIGAIAIYLWFVRKRGRMPIQLALVCVALIFLGAWLAWSPGPSFPSAATPAPRL
jgi:hypothetical protein